MKTTIIAAALALTSFSSFALTCKSLDNQTTYKLTIEENTLEAIDASGKQTFFSDILYRHEVDGETMLFIPNGLDLAASVKYVDGKRIVSIFGEENLACID